jgi:CubicO group peptidase (beta-lactamase class C family)
MKKIFSIIIIGIIFCSFGVQGFIFKKTRSEPINIDIKDIIFDLKMSFFIRLARFPSLSACIIEGDEVTWSKGYGFYDSENRKPATENTIYNIAQITKTVTGTALMQLWEQGAL